VVVEDDVGQREKEHAPLVLFQEDDRENLPLRWREKGPRWAASVEIKVRCWFGLGQKKTEDG
jgi:hypothetical protein